MLWLVYSITLGQGRLPVTCLHAHLQFVCLRWPSCCRPVALASVCQLIVALWVWLVTTHRFAIPPLYRQLSFKKHAACFALCTRPTEFCFETWLSSRCPQPGSKFQTKLHVLNTEHTTSLTCFDYHHDHHDLLPKKMQRGCRALAFAENAICLQGALSLTKLSPSTMAEPLPSTIISVWATRCQVSLQSSTLPHPEKRMNQCYSGSLLSGTTWTCVCKYVCTVSMCV